MHPIQLTDESPGLASNLFLSAAFNRYLDNIRVVPGDKTAGAAGNFFSVRRPRDRAKEVWQFADSESTLTATICIGNHQQVLSGVRRISNERQLLPVRRKRDGRSHIGNQAAGISAQTRNLIEI